MSTSSPLPAVEPVSARRQALDRAAVRAGIGFAHFTAHHWLALVNLFLILYLISSLAAPGLMALGWTSAANAIYVTLSLTCTQIPSHSYFLFGHQMGVCQRDLALYGTTLLAGLAFVPVRRRLRPLSWSLFMLFGLPMAVDGFTQLFGWRESTWELRTVTGALFAVGWVWLIYPWAEAHLLRMDVQLHRELQELQQSPETSSPS